MTTPSIDTLDTLYEGTLDRRGEVLLLWTVWLLALKVQGAGECHYRLTEPWSKLPV